MVDTGPVIYRRDTNGKVRFWNYEVDGNRWRSQSGVVGGTAVVSGWTVCTPKSQTTAEAQALFEARAELGQKLDRDYRPSLDLVDTPRAAGSKPMLAHKFDGIGCATCYSQPKLDGMRCIANKDGLWTRQGKAIVSVPHITAALAPWFAVNPLLELDGELYNHDLKDNFNELMSICRKSKPTDEDLEKAEAQVQYHIYDLVSKSPFSERFAVLRDRLFKLNQGDRWPVGTLSLVPTTLLENAHMLDVLYSMYIECGYEGQMVRLNTPYENKRSKSLLKRKEFLDNEFDIVRIESGAGTWDGFGKRLVFKLPDDRECGAGIRGTQAFTKALLDKADELVGKSVTIRYFTPTPDGMPRFPVAVDFHLDEQGRID